MADQTADTERRIVLSWDLQDFLEGVKHKLTDAEFRQLYDYFGEFALLRFREWRAITKAGEAKEGG